MGGTNKQEAPKFKTEPKVVVDSEAPGTILLSAEAEKGTIYFAVVKSGADALTAIQVKEGKSVVAKGFSETKFENHKVVLEEETAYDIYLVVEEGKKISHANRITLCTDTITLCFSIDVMNKVVCF